MAEPSRFKRKQTAEEEKKMFRSAKHPDRINGDTSWVHVSDRVVVETDLMQRLYVGGLSHTVTQKDLKDRFGKFGEVKDVELRTRRDDEGVPYKTFSYININISDADLKKCMTVLNKSKWKGGTLQIETAKESFLHRLTAERQEAAEQRLQQPAAEDKRQKMLNSLSKAGVENFTMKAAVPGTEIPGHKDWVVSKFGRVLPVLQLRCQKGSRARTLKYDPSKYSHNIRKLDRSTTEDEPTPISQLTWELEGGDDDISKKRRGEFPPFEPSRPKKSRTDVLNSHNTVGRSRSKQNVESVDQTETGQFTNGYEQPASHRLTQRRGAVFDNDIDSDEEIRRMVTAQSTSHAALRQEVDDDNLEVVGLDYLVKSGRSRLQQKGPDDEEENNYDSADTDELLASRKPPPLPPQERLTLSTAEQPSRNGTDKKRKTKKKSKAGEEEDDSADDEDHLTSRKPSSTQHIEDSSKQSKSKKMAAPPVLKPPVQESSSDSDDGDDEDEEEDEEEEEESVDSSSDSDYEAMFSNVTRLEISLADLQRLAEVSQQTTDPSTPSASSERDTPRRPAKKGTTPEEILASLMDEDSSEDEPKKKKKKKRKAAVSAPLPAFRGMGALNEGSEGEEEEEEEEERGSEVKKQKLESEAPQLNQRAKHMETEKKTSESSEDEEEEEEEEEDRVATKVLKVVPTKAAVNTKKAETSSSSSSGDEEEEEEEEESSKVTHTVLTAKVAASSSSSSSADEDEDELISDRVAVKAAPPPAPDSESSTSSSQEEEEKQAPPRAPLGAKEEEERQRKANMRRLAAVQQRQKEAEEHKKLIQGALAKLDAPTAGAGKHIVFGSDDDDDEDDQDKQQTTSEVTASTKALFEDSQSEDETTVKDNDTVKEKLSVPQLFSGSEDEEDGDEDDSRFDIRPQFEGRAGQKLMELQSRFGRDERFRMDSRFLEEDEDKDEESEKKRSVTEEDESLEDERKKNLSILQSVLGSSQQTCSSKAAAKGKTFRDISALHYDPSREEHAAFETKTDKTKESKSARRKKREEAQKLPEVSKEIYYDVSGDLKAVFGRTKEDNAEEEQKANWDQDEEEEEETKDEQPTLLSSLLSVDPSTEKEESSGFKFSFFGDDTETENKETEYKVESIQAPKVSWQQDPRFHDSSSEEDEEEQEENEEQSNAVAITTQEETPSKADLFFFFPEDSRLTEGPRFFCRSSHLEEQREQWEERRSALRQEYRKKHKDARRKLKSSQKS
ncbi:nucleolar protein 8 isoform X2 [Larimichthys crocea]|uniref:nucleolar protein 8 isoform X2 n=1 Tax=Larimichthys crocea TaxID=215358 RepID=UPI000F5F0B95|nr:nucleolar protein 8 isoform X2 [Larimichthys crocea]